MSKKPILKDMIFNIASLMSISGYEDYSAAKLDEYIGEYFDSHYRDAVGNVVYIKKCGKKNAAKILIDTHFDEIGMYVTDIKDGGFLTVIQIGGLDTRILQGAEVIIYGTREIYGVIASTPPHLQQPSDEKKLCEVKDLYIDTGYSKEELSTFVRVGTPVGYKSVMTELKNGRITGKGFDNKACGACAVGALAGLTADELCGDVYLLFSAHEETVNMGGAAVGAYNIDPDYAMVIDVNLGTTPDTKKYETVSLSEGVSITLSAVTDRKLTAKTIQMADRKGIKYQKCVSASNTGTNTPAVNLVRSGIPVVDVGLPLRCMHTYSEVISLDDAEQTAALIASFVCERDIEEVFKR